MLFLLLLSFGQLSQGPLFEGVLYVTPYYNYGYPTYNYPNSWQQNNNTIYILKTFNNKQYFLTSDGAFWKTKDSRNLAKYDQLTVGSFDDFLNAWKIFNSQTHNDFKAEKLFEGSITSPFPLTLKDKTSSTRFTLSDGAIWEVRSSDAITLRGWQPGDTIIIVRKVGSSSYYNVKNERTTNVVDATVKKTSPGAGDFSFVVGDQDSKLLLLNDDSVWQVSTPGLKEMAKWQASDGVKVIPQPKTGQYILQNQRVTNSQIQATPLRADN